MAKNGFIAGLMTLLALGTAPALADQSAPGIASVPPAAPAAAGATPAVATEINKANMCSYRNPYGQIPTFNADFWKGMAATRIGPGTVLTGIMEETISSKDSKMGDIFAIRLEDGYSVEGKELIPKGAKIVGSICGVSPAVGQKGGMPGQLRVSLQTLVFPDGSSTPFWGYIDHNPANDPSGVPGSGMPNPMPTIRRGGGTLLSLVTGKIGYRMQLPMHGPDLKIDKGLA
ncbi:MAG: hypothetical protein ACRD3W_31040, partial [Terriglobales bacterium]